MMRAKSITTLIAVALVAACGGGEEDLPPDAGVLRVVHAIPELGVLNFTLDDEELGEFNYSQIKGISRPGDARHRVLIDVRRPGDQDDTRLETLNLTTAVDRADTIVLTGTLDHANVLTWEQPARDWEAELAETNDEITVLEVSFAHASETRGPLDFYLGEEGFDPTDGSSIASIGYSELQEGGEIDAEALELVVTPAGDPATVLLRTVQNVLPAATSLLFVALDSDKLDEEGTPRLAVRSLGDGYSFYLVDQDLPTSLRAVHGARGAGAIDVLFGVEEDELLLASLEFRGQSPYVDVPLDTTLVTVTPAGDPDEVTTTLGISLLPGSQQTVVVSGENGEDEEDVVVASAFADDNRSVITAARFRVIQTASNFAFLDVYIVDPDESIEDLTPTVANVTYRGTAPYFQVAAGEYDLVLAESGTKDLVTDAMRVSVENGGIYTAIVIDGADEETVEVLPADDHVL